MRKLIYNKNREQKKDYVGAFKGFMGVAYQKTAEVTKKTAEVTKQVNFMSESYISYF